jgi:hypothetical protein
MTKPAVWSESQAEDEVSKTSAQRRLYKVKGVSSYIVITWFSMLCIKLKSEVGEWFRAGNRFVSFVRARCLVAKWNSSLNGTGEFSLFIFATPSLHFSIVWQCVFPFPRVKSKWDPKKIEVNSISNQSEIEVYPNRNRTEVELRSKWNIWEETSQKASGGRPH